MTYGKSFNGRCQINANGKVKGDDSTVQAKHIKMVLQHYYNRLNKRYTLALLERHSLQTKRNSNNQAKLQIEEIVIINDDKPAIIFIIFWDFLMFYQIFLSPQVKRCAIITHKHGMYELPHELPNDLRLRRLGNIRKVSKPHRRIAQRPFPPPKSKFC